jgi:CCR4-NOT transcription complex subunit 1
LRLLLASFKGNQQLIVTYLFGTSSANLSKRQQVVLASSLLDVCITGSEEQDRVLTFLVAELQQFVDQESTGNSTGEVQIEFGLVQSVLIHLGTHSVSQAAAVLGIDRYLPKLFTSKPRTPSPFQPQNKACINNPQLRNRVQTLTTKLFAMNSDISNINSSPVIFPTAANDGAGIVNILIDLGPACTSNAATFRDALRLVTAKLPGGNKNYASSSAGIPLKEGAMARLIHFFAAAGGTGRKNQNRSSPNENNSLSSAFVGVLMNDNGWNKDGGGGEWNLEVVSQVLSGNDFAINWSLVARSFDFPEFKVRDTRHLELLLALYRSGSKGQLPLEQITTEWTNHFGQLTLLENLLRAPPSVYVFLVNNEEAADAATVEGVANNCPNPQGWASAKVLQRFLHLSDDQTLQEKVRELFVVGLLSCPEIILCALVRLQLSVASAAAQQSSEGAKAAASAGMQLKGELMRELIPLFFKPNTKHVVKNGPGALRRLWSISQNTVLAACIEAWKSTVKDTQQTRFNTIGHIISVVRILPSPENAFETILNGNRDPDFSFTVAFVLADNDMLPLQPWLTDRMATAGANKIIFAVALTVYLGKNFTHAAPRVNQPIMSIENLATCLQFLVTLDRETLAGVIPSTVNSEDPNSSKGVTLGSSVKALVDACLQQHPNLANSVSAPPVTVEPSGNHPSGSQDDIEEMANSYFQKIYTSEQSAREVVEMLKRFKTSGSTRENDIFACMIHNLFDEYRFFSKYPEKELRITGILFGLLIKEQLVSSITLGIALRYVLEALRKAPGQSPQSGKMFRFGMFALEQFKERLHEWPQYCSHIVQIPHLREGYADLVSEIEGAMEDNHSQASSVATGPTAPTITSASRTVESSNDGNGAAVAMPGASMLGGEIIVPRSNQMAAIPSVSALIGGSAGGNNIAAPFGAGVGAANIELSAPTLPLKEQKPRKAVFGPGLGRAVNAPAEANDTQNEAPPDQILDRVQFLINNVSMSNVEQKSRDLKDMLESKYFGWLGNYLVVKRISTQPNFHSLYLSFLDNLGDYGKGLVEAILASVYVNVGKLLRSQKITTSTSERSLLKNLGSWLGQITLARNRPILQIMLDCKELLFQGYETGMLIAVTPFVAKILEGAKNSSVFTPPNPWLMGLLSVFRALYNVEDLKMNIKFEVEVLCKNLGIKLEEIPMRNADLSKRIPPVKEKNPDFNLKSQQSGSSAGATSTPSKADQGLALAAANSMFTSPDNKSSGASTGGDTAKSDAASESGSQDQQTVIPNLAAYVNVNPNLTQLFHMIQGGPLQINVSAEVLKRSVPIAVDRAIREIIQPVVERSVSIACITTKSIVTKDFAMESDENKMRKAAQLMVANLAGSLALVTCREPLHTSISSHLRQLVTNAINNAPGNSSSGPIQLSDQEKTALDQCVAICSTENLELGCMLIEKAATEKAVRDMDEALAPALSVRKKHREQTGQPYYDMSIFHNEGQRYPKALPEPLRPKPGGLRQDQLLVYDAFQRIPRQPAPSSQSDGQGMNQGGDQLGDESGNSSGGQLNLNAISAIAMKLDSSVTTLLNTAGHRAQEISLAMIPPDHEIKQLISAVPRVVAASDDPRSLSSSETDSILSFSQGIFKRLYEVDLSERLRLEALVSLLEMLNKICPQLGRDMGTWATYAPTKTDAQRKLHRTVLLLLVRSELIVIGELDSYLAKNVDEGRDPVWLEFLFLFVRTAVIENIASPASMPQMVGVIQSIAEDRAPVSPEVKQAFHKAATRLLEELRSSLDQANARRQAGGDAKAKAEGQTQPSYEESSSMSPASLKHLSDAPLAIAKTSQSFASGDPPNAKQLVTDILVNWLRVQSEAASNDKILAQFLQRLQQQFGVGSNDDQTERFMRLTTEVVIESCAKSVVAGDAAKTLNYNAVDGYAKLLSYLVRYMNGGGSEEQVSQQRLAFLNKVLGVVTRSLITNYEQSERGVNVQWDQRPWFRLLLDLVYELNLPNPALDPIKSGIVSVFGSAFHVVQPLVVPGTR